MPCFRFTCFGMKAMTVAPLDYGEDVEGVIVIDNGSLTMRAGFAGAERPRVVFPSVVGRPIKAVARVIDYNDPMEFYVGDDAQNKRGILAMNYPVKDGIVTSWEDMEKIWEHAFHELRVDSQTQPVLLSGSWNNPSRVKERMVEIMFEMFEVPGLYMERHAVLSLHAGEHSTGVAVNLGEGQFEAVPVHKGCVINNAVQQAGVSGKDLTELLIQMLRDRGVSDTERDIARRIKEELSYVSLDFKEEMQTAKKSSHVEQSYTLTDDIAVTLGDERFRCTEAMFDPDAVDVNGRGVPKTTIACILKCDRKLHSRLFSNIVVSGGNSLYPGFQKRIEKEMNALVPTGKKFNIVVDENINRVWLGGSKMASAALFKEMLLTNQEYKEFGSTMMLQKLKH